MFFSLGLKSLPGTNTLAYCESSKTKFDKIGLRLNFCQEKSKDSFPFLSSSVAAVAAVVAVAAAVAATAATAAAAVKASMDKL